MLTSMQERHNPIANALELRLYCINPPTYRRPMLSPGAQRPGTRDPVHIHTQSVHPRNYVHISGFAVDNCTSFTHIFQGLIHWHWGNHTIAPLPRNQPWRLYKRNKSRKFQHKNFMKQNKSKKNILHMHFHVIYGMIGATCFWCMWTLM